MIYATFLMRNDFFVPGALVFGYALKKQGIKDIVCFVTDEISKDARSYLEIIFDQVIVIDKLSVKHDNRKGRQDRSDLFTRFEVLKYYDDLTPLGSKFLLADSDILPLRNYAELSKAHSPSAILNERESHTTMIKDHQYVITDEILTSGTWHWHDIYADYLKGNTIPKTITDRVIDDPSNLGMNTSLLVFNTNLKDYDSIVDDLKEPSTQTLIQTFNWPEMQYLTQKWSGQWHTLDIRYASFSGYPRLDKVYGIHYAGLKPWAINHRSFDHYAKFKDFRLWQHVFLKMLEEFPELMTYPKLKKMKRIFEDKFEQVPYNEEELSHAPAWA